MEALQVSPEILYANSARILSGQELHRGASRAEHHMRVPDPDRREGAQEDEVEDGLRDGLRGGKEAGDGRGLRRGFMDINNSREQ